MCLNASLVLGIKNWPTSAILLCALHCRRAPAPVKSPVIRHSVLLGLLINGSISHSLSEPWRSQQKCWCLLGPTYSHISGSPSTRRYMEIHLILLLWAHFILSVWASTFDFYTDSKDAFETCFKLVLGEKAWPWKIFFLPKREVPRQYWTSLL